LGRSAPPPVAPLPPPAAAGDAEAPADDAEAPGSNAVAAAGAASPADAQKPARPDGRCDHCGSCVGVCRVCTVKQVTRKKTKICWDVRRVPHCIPGPSVHCGTRCGRDECGCYTYDVWKPSCGRVITKTEPVKREVTREMPGYEWTVEERCQACRRAASPASGCTSRE
jgi:hypothetical protein